MNAHSQRFIIMLENFIEVGQLGFNEKNISKKNEYFMNLTLIFLIYLLIFEKTKKNLVILNKMLIKFSSIISENNHLFLMILLSITDYESENFNLNYSDIMFYLRQNNIQKLKNYKNEEMNINRTIIDPERVELYIDDKNDIPRLYLDIINKTLDYVTCKNQGNIILENNIDLIIMDNIYTFFSNYDQS